VHHTNIVWATAEGSGRFLKKAAQKLLLCWGMGNVATTPMPQHKKVFLLLFVHKKKPSFSSRASGNPWLSPARKFSFAKRPPCGTMACPYSDAGECGRLYPPPKAQPAPGNAQAKGLRP
jgi:hypothetical protein